MKKEDLLPFVGRWVSIIKKGASARITGEVVSVNEDSFAFETWPENSDLPCTENVRFETVANIQPR